MYFMNSPKKYSDELIGRLHIIQKLQKKLVEEFGIDGYNAFVFGSFLTERFKFGISDIDIAVYTENVSYYIEIADFLLDFFKEYGIKVDIFYVNTQIVAPIFYAPLSSPVKMTSYYPENLQLFCDKCQKSYEKCLEAVV